STRAQLGALGGLSPDGGGGGGGVASAQETSCSICLAYFQDPVSIPCGHSFCRSCISRCWEALEAPFPCPRCRQTAPRRSLRPSRELPPAEVSSHSREGLNRPHPLPYPAADVTLDPSTAHPNLRISEDLREARGHLRAQDVEDSPRRFDYEPCVLGRGGFTSGRHFWDVDVGQGGVWALGVARASVRRKGPLSPGPKEGVWALEAFHSLVRALTPRKVTLLPLRWVPRRVSVHLDYGGGTVAFFDADEGGLMFIFSRAAFTGERVRPWLWVVGEQQITRQRRA
uniref:Uncharacterized protein n=1 Tax=Amazona collaria TaxID=241587 RepID=A0A8B9FRZ4_9PSIT